MLVALIERHFQRDLTALGEFDRVSDQVHDDLPDAARVAHRCDRHPGLNVARQFEALFVRAIRQRLHRFFDRIV